MKKVLLILFTLFVLLSAAAAFFIATFDANQLKPVIESKLTEAIGNKVTLGDLSLNWDGGVKLSIEDIGIYKEGAGTPSFEIREAHASVKLLPLLNRNLEVGKINVVRPDIRVIRNPAGRIDVDGIDLAKLQAKEGDATQAAALPFLIKSIEIEKAKIHFRDLMMQPPAELEIKELDIALENVSLIRPTQFKLSAALFSDAQNTHLEGRFFPPRPGRQAAIKDALLKLSLHPLKVNALVKSYPPASSWGLVNEIRGNLSLKSGEIILDEEELKRLSAEFTLEEGYIEHIEIKDPVRNIALNGGLEAGTLTMKKLHFNWAESRIAFAGKIQNVFTQPVSDLNGSIENFNLGKLALKRPPAEPYIDGVLNASLDGAVRGLEWPQISTTLSGDSHIKIDQPVLVNINILREVFAQLSNIPGLERRLRERLTPEYLSKLDAQNTVFDNIDLRAKAMNGVLDLKDIRLASETFVLTGVAQSTLNGMVEANFMITLDNALTDAFTRSVEELKYLNNKSGQLQIPLSYKGHVQKFRPLPNLQYVASKLTVMKAQDLIGDFLNKKAGTPQPTGQEQSSQPASNTSASNGTAGTAQASSTTQNQKQVDPLESLVSGLLKKALE